MLEIRCHRLDKEGVTEAIILNFLNGVSIRAGRYPFFQSLENDTFGLGFGAAISFLPTLLLMSSCRLVVYVVENLLDRQLLAFLAIDRALHSLVNRDKGSINPQLDCSWVCLLSHACLKSD